jgi:hypothetical protein
MLFPTLVCACLISGVPTEQDWQTYRDTKARTGRDAQAHLRLAHWCGERGMDAERQRHLAIALVIAPDNPTVRGLLGFVRQDGQWRRVPADAGDDSAMSAESLAARSEYLAKRSIARFTPEAQWQLVLWCEKRGMKAEARAHAETVVRLDPNHELAWGRLGFRKHDGRFMTEAQIAAESIERDAQARADRKWLPILSSAKDRLASRKMVDARERRSAAKRLLADINDPRAVPTIWRLFVTDRAPDQDLAVQMLGQIASRESSRSLAVLSVFGNSPAVRRFAIETLAGRDPKEYADLLVGLFRNPVRYEVVPVMGPGVPGILRVEGARYHTERVYVSPPPPDLPIFNGENVTFDEQGLPVLHRHTDTVALPFAWVQANYTFPSGAVAPPHVPVVIRLGDMWRENWKSAASAQQQLRNDAAVVERFNERIRAANRQLAGVFNHVTRQRLEPERDTWRRWWSEQLGRTYTPEPDRPRPIASETVAPSYLPRDVAGLGFDPVGGYYMRVPVR